VIYRVLKLFLILLPLEISNYKLVIAL